MIQFTVVIPTYNRTEFLIEAIRSVYAQTFESWEILVIDDGSDVPAGSSLREFEGDRRFRYVYHRNIGVGATRQTAVNLARGKYLCYLDDDDYFLPHHLGLLYGAMQDNHHQIALYKTGIIQIDEQGSELLSIQYSRDRSMLEQHWLYADSLLPYAVPREVAIRIPSVQYYFAQDFNWLARLMLDLPVIQIDEYSVVYRWHGSNRTASITNHQALTGRLNAVQDLYEIPAMVQAIRRSTYLRMMAHQVLHYCRLCARKSKYSEAGKKFFFALKYLNHRSLFEYAYTFYIIMRTLSGSRLYVKFSHWTRKQKQV